jgi:hypothetical protein
MCKLSSDRFCCPVPMPDQDRKHFCRRSKRASRQNNRPAAGEQFREACMLSVLLVALPIVAPLQGPLHDITHSASRPLKIMDQCRDVIGYTAYSQHCCWEICRKQSPCPLIIELKGALPGKPAAELLLKNPLGSVKSVLPKALRSGAA